MEALSQESLRETSEPMSTSLANKLFRNGDVHPLKCNLSVLGLFRNKCFKAT